MLCHRIGLALLTAMILGLANLTYATPLTVTETFDSAASTAADGWVGYNNVGAGNDFGFSNTGIVSGSAGEIGGIFARTDAFPYFADTTLGGSLSRTETLVMSGSLLLSSVNFNGTVIVGYFNTGDLPSESSGPGPFIGIGITEPSLDPGGDPNFHASARIYTDAGYVKTDSIPLSQGTTYAFHLTWAGNPDGSGALSGTIAGSTVSISQGPSNDVFNAFGIASGFISPANSANSTLQTGPSYFDNLSYSTYSGDSPPTPVPEPSTMVLLGTGLVGLAGVRRKIKK